MGLPLADKQVKMFFRQRHLPIHLDDLLPRDAPEILFPRHHNDPTHVHRAGAEQHPRLIVGEKEAWPVFHTHERK